MSRSRHFTQCRYCNKEYTCGDCITDNCELGHDKKSCEGYKGYLIRETATARTMMSKFSGSDKQHVAMCRMIADGAWDNVVSEMTNTELSDAILHEIWAKQEIGSREGALLSAAIDRLRQPAKDMGGV